MGSITKFYKNLNVLFDIYDVYYYTDGMGENVVSLQHKNILKENKRCVTVAMISLMMT